MKTLRKCINLKRESVFLLMELIKKECQRFRLGLKGLVIKLIPDPGAPVSICLVGERCGYLLICFAFPNNFRIK